MIALLFCTTKRHSLEISKQGCVIHQIFRTLNNSNLERDIEISKNQIASKRKKLLNNYISSLNKLDPNTAKPLLELRRQIQELRSKINVARIEKSDQDCVEDVQKRLQKLKDDLDSLERDLLPSETIDTKSRLEGVLAKRFFFRTSSYIYGGISGLMDFGPLGLGLKKKIINEWEKYFIYDDDLQEIETSILTSDRVLENSGHVDKFSDLVVSDIKTKELYRLDGLLKYNLEQLANKDGELNEDANQALLHLKDYSKAELIELINKFSIISPKGNKLSEPKDMNLMFHTGIGPLHNQIKSFLRPETAQGIFTSFDFFQYVKLPYGICQIGKCFRNEISPRGSLVRLREFTLAEIEFFVDPENKYHPKYDTIKKTEVLILTKDDQSKGVEVPRKITIQEAVDLQIIANQALGYYIGKIMNFMINIGIDMKRTRFRQHMDEELAHYATDCWDFECLTMSGWLECVGCADRSSYDLICHQNPTKKKVQIVENVEDKLPHVIEPSFGIERIMHTLFDHSFVVRSDNQRRSYFTFPPKIAPVQCSIFAIINNPEFQPIAQKLHDEMKTLNIRVQRISSNKSIGKKYALSDEAGIPFSITIDSDTVTKQQVTIRYRDTAEQICVDIKSVAEIINSLSSGKLSWDEAKNSLTIVKNY